MSWWTKAKSSSIKYVCPKKEVTIISINFRGNCDLFFCPIRKTTLTIYSGCRSPPKFDLKNFKSNRGNKKWTKNQKEVLMNREKNITEEKIVKEFLRELHSHNPRRTIKEAELILTKLFPKIKV